MILLERQKESNNVVSTSFLFSYYYHLCYYQYYSAPLHMEKELACHLAVLLPARTTVYNYYP